MGEPRGQVPGGVNGVPRGPPEPQGDPQDQEADEEGGKALDQLVSQDGLDAENQKGGGQGLGEGVGYGESDGRGGGEDGKLNPRVRGLGPVGRIGQPDQNRPQELARPVPGDQALVHLPGQG